MKSYLILLISLALLLASCSAQTLESVTDEQVCKSNCRCKAIENYWDAVLLFDDEENSGAVVNASSPPTAFGSTLFELALVFNHTEATIEQIQNNTFEFGLRYALFVVANQTLFAHIHVGKRCNEGPIVAFLFNSSALPVNSTGLLASGYITANDFVGPLANHSFWSLIEEIEAGNAYVNVHTVPYPEGEARGQIQFTQHQSDTVLDLINSTRCSKSFGTFYKLFNFSTFNSSNNSSNSTVLEPTLSLSDLNNSSRNFTVFFPPDNILAAIFESLASNNISESEVEDFLSAHIVAGYFTSADLHVGFNNSGSLNLTTISGSILLIGGPEDIVPGSNGTAFLQSSLVSSIQINNETTIIRENSIVATNGIIHSINRPLVQLVVQQQNATTTAPVSKLRMAKLFARAIRYF